MPLLAPVTMATLSSSLLIALPSIHSKSHISSCLLFVIRPWDNCIRPDGMLHCSPLIAREICHGRLRRASIARHGTGPPPHQPTLTWWHGTKTDSRASPPLPSTRVMRSPRLPDRWHGSRVAFSTTQDPTGIQLSGITAYLAALGVDVHLGVPRNRERN